MTENPTPALIVRRVRFFFRDGPRSLRRQRVTRERPSGEDRALAVVAGLTMMTIGVVAFVLAPTRWLGWSLSLILVTAGVLATQRITLARMRKRFGAVTYAPDIFLTPLTFSLLWTYALGAFAVIALTSPDSWEWPALLFPGQALFYWGLWRFNREVRAARAQYDQTTQTSAAGTPER